MDRVILHLNTSALSFTAWLISHYLRGDFAVYAVRPWVLKEVLKGGEPPAIRLAVTAVLRSDDSIKFAISSSSESSDDSPTFDLSDDLDDWDDEQPEQDEPAALKVFGFDACDIGTERDARVEVMAECIYRDISLRMHFYSVLACIANAWPEALEALDRARRAYESGQIGIGAVIGPAPYPSGPPWLQIPDVGWDRPAVELLWKGYTSEQIAGCIGKDITAKTVDNRLSELRAQYGTAIVPYRRDLRKLEGKSGKIGK